MRILDPVALFDYSRSSLNGIINCRGVSQGGLGKEFSFRTWLRKWSFYGVIPTFYILAI